MKQEYCLGFYFYKTNNTHRVYLIRKSKNKGPEVIRGLWNGLGGKLEEGETAVGAMIREFEEESGHRVIDWDYRIKMEGRDYILHIFSTVGPPFVPKPVFEEVGSRLVGMLPSNSAPHVNWLVPFLNSPIQFVALTAND
ncbi:MAG TPA: NUDIX domain-containing protein [bacterium]|nr:NUDIX domain-containing protein [bacterium]